MDLQIPPVDQFQVFIICAARVAGFINGTTIIFDRHVPTLFKAGYVVMLSLVLFPIMSPFIPKGPLEMGPFFFLIVNETLVGLIIGLMVTLIFTAIQFGGTVIGYQMGFAAANVFDPQNQNQTSLISEFNNVFAIFLFLALNVHHVFIRAAVKSYEILPPGKLDLSHAAIPYLLGLSSKMFVLSLQFSAPVLAMLLLSGLILGILARIFPQLNVFLLSYPLNIGISFIVIGLTLNMASILLRREFDSIPERINTLLHFMN
ncbi:MAG: flagellar biosynthetic protein FliR [Desulfocapsaceae bacterium]|nr:flagellar biosynthetic protein FliR [Desulfocapsaceae bacterium]